MSAGTRKVRKDSDFPAMERAKFDRFHQAVTMIGDTHRLTHDGMVFRTSRLVTDALAANGSTYAYGFSVPAGVVPHLRVTNFNAEAGPLVWRFYEDASFTGGTVMPVKNGNRIVGRGQSPQDSGNQMVITRGVTVGSPLGSRLATHYIQGSGAGGFLNPRSGTSGDDPGEEWILAPGVDYMIVVTNIGGGSNVDLAAQFIWYELDYEQ